MNHQSYKNILYEILAVTKCSSLNDTNIKTKNAFNNLEIKAITNEIIEKEQENDILENKLIMGGGNIKDDKYYYVTLTKNNEKIIVVFALDLKKDEISDIEDKIYDIYTDTRNIDDCFNYLIMNYASIKKIYKENISNVRSFSSDLLDELNNYRFIFYNPSKEENKNISKEDIRKARIKKFSTDSNEEPAITQLNIVNNTTSSSSTDLVEKWWWNLFSEYKDRENRKLNSLYNEYTNPIDNEIINEIQKKLGKTIFKIDDLKADIRELLTAKTDINLTISTNERIARDIKKRNETETQEKISHRQNLANKEASSAIVVIGIIIITVYYFMYRENTMFYMVKMVALIYIIYLISTALKYGNPITDNIVLKIYNYYHSNIHIDEIKTAGFISEDDHYTLDSLLKNQLISLDPKYNEPLQQLPLNINRSKKVREVMAALKENAAARENILFEGKITGGNTQEEEIVIGNIITALDILCTEPSYKGLSEKEKKNLYDNHIICVKNCMNILFFYIDHIDNANNFIKNVPTLLKSLTVPVIENNKFGGKKTKNTKKNVNNKNKKYTKKYK